MGRDDYARFRHLTFADFRRFATDPTMSEHEKVGFPDEYREGRDEDLLADIRAKLGVLSLPRQVVLDIGPGCSSLTRRFIELCAAQEHELLLVDSEEMLAQLPDQAFIRKMPGCYPRDCDALFEAYRGRVNAILSYSVLHYVFAEGNLHRFVDQSLTLLAPGGAMLLGDIPNISKRKRFFASAAGVRFHQKFSGTSESPSVQFNTIEPDEIDDAVIVSLLLRCRAAGFDAYVLSQPPQLPMSNRREDLLVVRP